MFESIKCLNGRIYNIDAHNQRVNSARRKHFGVSAFTNLRKYIQVPEDCKEGLYKCRISYGEEIDRPVFSKYIRKSMTSLKLIESSISYDYKWEAREELAELFANRGPCDDVLIVKDGLITDTSYANVALFDGKEWFTPKRPLLEGTMRARMLDRGKLKTRDIKAVDLLQYKKLALINALNNLGQMVIGVKNVSFPM